MRQAMRLTAPHRGVAERNESSQFEEGAICQYGRHFGGPLPGEFQRVARTLFPFPEGMAQTEADLTVSHGRKAVDEVFLVTPEMAAFQDQGEDHMVAPPDEGTEGKFDVFCKKSRVIQILIREILKVFSLDELAGVRVEAVRNQQAMGPKFALKGFMDLFQQVPDFWGDAGLGCKELGIGQQGNVFGRKIHGSQRGDDGTRAS